jgi:hypothetical protein
MVGILGRSVIKIPDTRLQQLAKTDRNPVQEEEYQRLLKEQGGGEPGVDFGQIPSVQEYIKSQFAAEDPYLKEILTRMGEREAPLEIYGRLEEEAGLPLMRRTATTLMKEIGDIEDLLLQIEPDVTAKTRESLVTEAQRRGIISEERKPWMEKLTRMGTALGRLGQRMGVAERTVGTKVELAMVGQQMELEPFQFAYSVMVDRNTRLLTGFTEDRELQLDIMWDKLNRNRYLADREWELAANLAIEEREYIKELQTAAAGMGVTLSGGEGAGEILAKIGGSAREETQWQRGYKTGAYETPETELWGIDSMIDDILRDLEPGGGEGGGGGGGRTFAFGGGAGGGYGASGGW